MSRRGVHGLRDLVRDLWRELPPLVRAGLFAGVGLGVVLGLVFLLRAPPDYGPPPPGKNWSGPAGTAPSAAGRQLVAPLRHPPKG